MHTIITDIQEFMFSIRFKETQEWIILPAKVVFPMRWTSDLFSENFYEGMWSLPVTLDYDPALWNALKLPHIPAVLKQENNTFEVDVLIGKSLVYSSSLQIIQANAKQIEVSIFSNPFPETFGSQTLKEVMAGVTYEILDFDPWVTVELFGTSSELTWEFHYGSLNYVVVSGTTVDETIDALVLEINNTTGDTGIYAINLGSGYLKMWDPNMWNQGLVSSDISQGGIETGITIGDIDWTTWVLEYHDALKVQMKVVSTEDGYGTYDYTFFPVYNPGFYDGANESYANWVNAYENTFEKYLMNIDSTTSWVGHKYTVVPFLYFKKIFDTVFANAGINLSGDFYSREGFNQLVFYNMYCLDMLHASEDWIVQNKDITASNHLPDMTVKEMLEGLQALFNLRYQYNPNKNELIIELKSESVDTSKNEMLKNMPQLTMPLIKYKQRQGYTFSSKHDTGDEYSEFFGIQHADWVEGDGANSIESAFSWPSMEERYDAVGPIYPGDEFSTAFFPVVNQKGSSNAYSIYGEWTPRLLFYRGMDEDSLGNEFPYATNNSYDSQHNFEDQATGEYTFDLTFAWHKLFSDFYAGWIKYLNNNVTCDITLLFHLHEIGEIDWAEQYEFIQSLWLIESIEITEAANRDLICKLQLINAPSYG